MKIHLCTDSQLNISFSSNDTEKWARKWPCSTLSGKSFFVEFDNNGLVDTNLTDVDGHELNAFLSDKFDLAERVSNVKLDNFRIFL